MKILLTEKAKKQLSTFDGPVAERIKTFLKDLEVLQNPRSKGKELTGTLSGLWRYRVGDFRILCRIQDDLLLILVVELGGRKDIYR